MTDPSSLRSDRSTRSSAAPSARAAALLAEARERERTGRLDQAMEGYDAAIDGARRSGEVAVLCEALRRRAVLHHQNNEPARAQALAWDSHDVAHAGGQPHLAAEALNALGAMAVDGGALAEARDRFRRALALIGDREDLRGRLEQNLGVVANVQGDYDSATRHYEASLAAYGHAGDEMGRAIAHHNLGMLSSDRGAWDAALDHFRRSLQLARAVGAVHLEGLCTLNRAEVELAVGRHDAAQHDAEDALRLFEQLGMRLDQADAFRVLGMVHRESGRRDLAESKLQLAIELAASTGSVLTEAEAHRELARLRYEQARPREAVAVLNVALELFGQLDARRDVAAATGELAKLEAAYLNALCQPATLAAADLGNPGHGSRVADYACQIGQLLGLRGHEQVVLRIGAQVHDVGKARVAPEILCKPGPLTEEEWAVVRRHPVWGLEMLAGVDLPADVLTIVRSHHEKCDGSGYPDGLRGDAIPMVAQIVGLADVYDALTSERSYRPALAHEAAVDWIIGRRYWWWPQVYGAFMEAVARGLQSPARAFPEVLAT